MGFIIKKFEKTDIPVMIDIWNEVVKDGIAFPQMELLDETSGYDMNFLLPNRLLELQRIKKQERFMDFIYCIQIMLEDADILQMQVMR